MSQQVTIHTELKSKHWDIIEKALNNLQWNVETNVAPRSYFKQKVSPLVAVNPEKCGYDLTVDLSGEEVSFGGDLHDGSIVRGLGENLGRLKQQYVIENVRKDYQSINYFNVETDAEGGVFLEIDGIEKVGEMH